MKNPKTEHLTRLAKKVSKEKGISHCQALALIAKDLGFKTWSAYLESIK